MDVTARRLAEAATGVTARSVTKLRGGLANAMFVAILDGGQKVVVRIARGQPERIEVEAAVMSRGAAVLPVPDVLLVDPTGEIAGKPAMVISFVEGERARTVIKRSPSAAAAIGRAMGDAIGALSTITFDTPGWFTEQTLTVEPVADGADVLGSFLSCMHRSPTTHEVERSIEARWLQLVADRPRLRAYVAQAAALVHGDCNANNLLVAERDGTWAITGVLDWEWSFSGSPIFDLAALLRGGASRPPAFAEALIGAYELRTGAPLPDGWREGADLLADLQIWEFASPVRRTPLAPALRWLARKGAVG